MNKKKMYRYLGRNGIITSPILLENIAPIPLYELHAAAGKVLTDGTQFVKIKLVFEDELNNWTEIDDPNI
jgi:hypothetical protein